MHFIFALTALLPAFVAIQALPSPNVASPAVPVTNRPPVLSHITFNNDTNGRITFDKESPNGLYIYHNATHFSYHGETDTSTNKISANDGLDKRQTTCNAYCQGGVVSGDDATNAINGLANTFGEGFNYHGIVVYNHGEASAFGCDYGTNGEGQVYTAAQYNFDISCMTSFCGLNNVIGWNSHNSWYAKYGINIVGFSCR